jgi:hypothetical protein
LEISRSIINSPVVVLTGAGASVALGKLTTEGFLRHLFDVARHLDTGDGSVRILLDAIGEAIGQGHDVEDVLATLEQRAAFLRFVHSDPLLQSELRCDSSHAAALAARIDTARDFIHDQVIDHYGAVDAMVAADLYRVLFLHLDPWLQQVLEHPIRTLPFFTLNYDRAVEAACSTLGVRCVDGITQIPGKTERRWARTVFQEYEASETAVSVVLVKLHGSVRLGRRPMAAYGLPEDELVELPEAIQRNPRPYEHAVIYPSRLPKDLTSEPFYTHYRIFNACLQHAKLLVVIGCSVRDPDVQIALRTAVEDNPSLRILVLDPAAEHGDIAMRVHISPKVVAVERRAFEVEPGAERGMSTFMGIVRGYLASSLDVPPGFPFVFDQTNEAIQLAGALPDTRMFFHEGRPPDPHVFDPRVYQDQ